MIIGLSGKKQSGKDTVAHIIQYLMFHSKLVTDKQKEDWTYQEFSDTFDTIVHSSSPSYSEISGWQIKRFADKLKDIVCLLINCTRRDLEDNNFKEKELGEEWVLYRLHSKTYELYGPRKTTKEEAENFKFSRNYWRDGEDELLTLKMTPRLLLQLIGTECGRNIIHPNIWVNTLISEYVKYNYSIPGMMTLMPLFKFPDWIITDVRFPNEVEAIEDKGGVVLRIEREFQMEEIKNEKGTLLTINPQAFKIDLHPSETSLDNHEFKYTIYNSSTITDLIEKTRAILHKLKLI